MRQAGLVLSRARAERGVLAAVALTVGLSTTLLTTLVAYGDEVTRAGVAAVVADAPAVQRAVELSAPSGSDDSGDVARTAEVQAVATEAFAGLDPRVDRSTISGTFDVVSTTASPAVGGTTVRTPLAVLAAYDDLAEHADLLAGAWADEPAEAGPLPVTVHASAADALGLVPGDRLSLATTVGEEPLEVVVSGTYRPRDAGDTAFFGDLLEVTGRDDGSFTSLGPLAATPEGYEARVPGRSIVRYRIAPDPARLDVSSLPRAVEGAEVVRSALEDDVVSIGGRSARVLVESDLGALEAAVTGPARVARSTVLVPVLLLSLLAGVALVLAVALLGERRRTETTTLLARGTTRGQVARWGGAEAAALVLPAAALAPLLAAAALAALDRVGPLRRSGLRLAGAPEPAWWVTSSAVALAFGVLLVAVTGTAAAQRGGARASRGSILARGGTDIGLLVLAGLSLLQLRRYGISGTAGLEGTRTDPLVAAAPTVVVLAVAVVALRALPAVTRLVRTGLGRHVSLSALLALWHVGRRPTRYSGPALLLVMATAVGTLSLAYTATWTGAQQDVADYVAGADVRVVAAAGDDADAPVLTSAERTRAYAGVPGVEAVMPGTRVARRGTESSTLLAVDAVVAPAVMAAREDLQGDRSLQELVAPLVEARPDLPGLPVPDDATALRLTAVLQTSGDGVLLGPAQVSLVLQDAAGTLTSLDVGEVAAGAGPQVLGARLDPGSDTGLAVVAVDAVATTDASVGVSLRFSVATIEGVRADGGAVPLEADGDWVSQAIPGSTVTDQPTVRLAGDRPGGFEISGTTSLVDRVDTKTTLFRTALEGGPVLAVRPDQRSGFVVPAVATRELLDREDASVGDRLAVQGPRGDMVVVVTGTVDRLPTVAAESGAVLVDLPSLAAASLLSAGAPVEADEWWLGTQPGTAADVAQAVSAVPAAPGVVQDRDALAVERLSTPLGIGVSGALGVGALAALAVACIGFAVHGAASARERLTEFAVLRATGFSHRQLLAVLATEQGVLAGSGLVLGVAAGLVSSALLVPDLVAPSLAGSGGPPPSLAVPLGSLAVFALVVLAVLAAVALLVGRTLRAAGLGSALRLGEDR